MSLNKLFVLGLICACTSAFAADGDANAKSAATRAKKKRGATAARSLASLAPTRNLSQGELMLQSVKSANPRFLKTSSTGTVPVKLASVCRDAYGTPYSSGDKGYSRCLDADSSQAGSQSEYFASQRQAGVGILLGR